MNFYFSNIFILSLLSFFLISNANATEYIFFAQMNNDENCQLRILVQRPDPSIEIKSDLLFLIGYGDRADNHKPLFDSLNNVGVRVLTFDYPEHGESKCGSLDMQTFTTLIDYTEQIEQLTRDSQTRPLFIAGWSLGGLLSLRIMQGNHLSKRQHAGLILIAPGISVYPFVGGDGIIRQETLLSNPNPPHRGPISPKSPFLTPIFSSVILWNAHLARKGDLSADLPTLIIEAGDKEDLYTKTYEIKKWTSAQKSKQKTVYEIQYANAKHELDNEIEPIGTEVRNAISAFVTNPFLSPVNAG